MHRMMVPLVLALDMFVLAAGMLALLTLTGLSTDCLPGNQACIYP